MEKLSLLFYTLVAIDFFLVAKQLDFVHGSPPKEAPAVGIYELKKGDMSVKFTNWGASIISLVLPDKYGTMGDITLGYDSVKDYMNDTTYFGGVVGRVANRIGGAKFTLNGTEYKLKANEGKNMLHGGPKGYSDVIWNVTKYKNDSDHPCIRFSYDSHDGEEGFPGEVQVSVMYTLINENELSVAMRAKANKKYTPVNLAQHTYWNLGNHDSGDILSEKILIFASNYTPVDSELIPTGEIVAVKGTPYDFLEPQTIGSRINELPKGYDINYALDGSPNEMKRVAIVKDKKSGRVMELSANQPGVQFYTGNMIKDVKGKGGFIYKAHAGLCLETQGYPDSVNHPNFPSQIIAPGKYYRHNMLFKFSIEP
ncbi:Aldose 1-/Glucose-6-phosphate 1-epimerase [Corchorus capsularis]|uniref:Aldose 1-epimerase n=1 Tax=Corchorus capsularis TaxID=210143 RepID=A0A1R3HFL1_COCAP|nr:Aldose 1-/Glucose-6-phosphate 1-epimerase [Corchorus capsularis]